jgi:D-alanyl-D-alanine carboxypeptidase
MQYQRQIIHFKSLVLRILLLTVLTVFLSPSLSHANNKYGSIVIDADTGMVLSQRHADKILHPASLTKMMTMLMVFEALEQRKISLNDRIRISHHAASMQPSKIGLPAGGSIKVNDAMRALAVKSANDIAVAVAEFIGGSEHNFAKMMTNKAREIGMKKTRFINASGLHDPRQVSTPRDMARLSRYLIYRHAQYYSYFSLKSFKYRGKTYTSHNKLMKTYKGMDGLKTGYINASGFNLAATAKRNNRRIIGVVFGGRSSKTRNAHMKVLLDRGFRNLKEIPQTMASASTSMLYARIPTPLRKPYTPQMLANNMSKIMPSSGQLSNIATMAKAQITNQKSINNSKLSDYLGQGDVDDDFTSRIETGLIAISAHTGQEYNIAGIGTYGKNKPKLFKTNVPANNHINSNTITASNWSVQLGAFKSRAKTDQALVNGLRKLPSSLTYGRSIIAPVRHNNMILFRGRLTGYNQSHAQAICKIIRNCQVIAPSNL